MKAVKTGKTKKAKIVPMNSTIKTEKKSEKPSQNHIKRVSTDSEKLEITHEMIAQRAWSIWMSRGCKPGQEEMNWHQAELELKSTINKIR